MVSRFVVGSARTALIVMLGCATNADHDATDDPGSVSTALDREVMQLFLSVQSRHEASKRAFAALSVVDPLDSAVSSVRDELRSLLDQQARDIAWAERTFHVVTNPQTDNMNDGSADRFPSQWPRAAAVYDTVEHVLLTVDARSATIIEKLDESAGTPADRRPAR